MIGYAIIKSAECIIHYPEYDYIVDKVIRCEKCNSLISIKYNNYNCMSCIYSELLGIYNYKFLKDKMMSNGLAEELTKKVFHPNNIIKYLEKYNYDLSIDEYI